MWSDQVENKHCAVLVLVLGQNNGKLNYKHLWYLSHNLKSSLRHLDSGLWLLVTPTPIKMARKSKKFHIAVFATTLTVSCVLCGQLLNISLFSCAWSMCVDIPLNNVWPWFPSTYLCRAVVQIFLWGWEKLLWSWCSSADHTGCSSTTQTPNRDGS